MGYGRREGGNIHIGFEPMGFTLAKGLDHRKTSS